VPKKERGLGRGLDALLSSTGNLYNGEQLQELELKQIKAKNNQPRKSFEKEALKELADSIKEHGVLQPILVKPKDDGYEIVAGERRWRAAAMAGLNTVPVIIKDVNDMQADEISLIENLQRDDLTVVEEARAYKNMMENYGYTQESLAARIGKSRSQIANTVRILALPEQILDLLEQRKLSAGHARALLAIGNPKDQMRMANAIIENKLSVRQIEKDVKKSNPEQEEKPKARKIPEIMDLEERIQLRLGTKAEISSGKKGGRIVIQYYSLDDLQRIIDILGF
jgi:ParB family chromosome partitioning protein